MTEKFTFDDVLIEPQFSTIKSRSEVDVKVYIPGIGNVLPIMSANMDTVTGVEMAIALQQLGAIGCLPRFGTVDDNVNDFLKVGKAVTTDEGDPKWVQLPVAVSFGLGDEELYRAMRLYQMGARLFVLDVAHAAQQQVVDQYRNVKQACADAFIIVGNFATLQTVKAFIGQLGYCPDGIKIGVGPGSACTTRIKTGVGYPQWSAIKEICDFIKTAHWMPVNVLGLNGYEEFNGGFETDYSKCLVIADGGMKTPGDIAKALGAGADMVMLGGMLAGTEETPGAVHSGGQPRPDGTIVWTKHKTYRGSASKESYDDQGKNADFRTAEGESFTVPCKGPVKDVLQDIIGGLKSAFTYVGARNLSKFHEKVKFVHVSGSTIRENGAHGKKA